MIPNIGFGCWDDWYVGYYQFVRNDALPQKRYLFPPPKSFTKIYNQYIWTDF